MSVISAIESLEDEIYNDGIGIVDAHFSPTKKAACLHKEGVYKGIILDISKIESHKEWRALLVEEYSHYDSGALYFLESTINMPNGRSNRIYCEAKAKRHKIEKYLPFEHIQKAVDDGCRSDYELSEVLGWPLPFVLEAIAHYERKGLKLNFKED